MDPRSALTKLGFGVLAFNSGLAIRNSWGDADAASVASVAFVFAADAALLLLFLCLRRFERAGGGAARNIKAAVWALTALLTSMFASRVAPLMPPAVAAVVWVMAVERARGGDGGAARDNMAGTYSALANVGFAVVNCNMALDAYDGRRDALSASLVLMCYAVLVIVASLFVRAFARAHGDGQGQGY
ncbi:unnamed protein product [Urochloa humidicola]